MTVKSKAINAYTSRLERTVKRCSGGQDRPQITLGAESVCLMAIPVANFIIHWSNVVLLE